MIGRITQQLRDLGVSGNSYHHRTALVATLTFTERKTSRPRQHLAEQDDEICILLGFPTSFLLRPADSVFKLVDQCGIDELMDGEAPTDIGIRGAYDSEPGPGLEDFEI